MKKVITLATLLLSTTALAGFQDPQAAMIKSVAQAKKAPDNRRVQLTGNITRALGDEKYQFQDRTGQIILDIDEDIWYGLNATPKTRVQILGEVDKEYGRTEIDVKQIRKLN